MSLRLLDTPEPDPLPSGELLVGDERRPGELHDVVALDDHTSSMLADKASASGISVGVALTLLIELQLLKEDLGESSLALGEPPPTTSPRLRLSAAEANYLRGLTLARDTRRITVAKNASVPVRLLTRTTRDTIARAVAGDLEHAIRWEIAAITTGRTINELGLFFALRSSATRS